jgi:hypothetical protein
MWSRTVSLAVFRFGGCGIAVRPMPANAISGSATWPPASRMRRAVTTKGRWVHSMRFFAPAWRPA